MKWASLRAKSRIFSSAGAEGCDRRSRGSPLSGRTFRPRVDSPAGERSRGSKGRHLVTLEPEPQGECSPHLPLEPQQQQNACSTTRRSYRGIGKVHSATASPYVSPRPIKRTDPADTRSTNTS